MYFFPVWNQQKKRSRDANKSIARQARAATVTCELQTIEESPKGRCDFDGENGGKKDVEKQDNK